MKRNQTGLWVVLALLALIVAFVGLSACGSDDPEVRGAPVYKGSFVAPDSDDYVRLWDGADLVGYSDEGSTQTFLLDAATGNLVVGGSVAVTGVLTSTGGQAMAGALDLDGQDLVMDADGDSIFDEKADDQVRLGLGAAAGYLEINSGNLRVGNGTPGETHDGEDLYVEGISEFDGASYFDGVVDMDSTLGVADDVTLDAASGTAGAKNEYIGLPRVKMVGLGAGTNGTVETVAYIDTTPTGEWAEVDGGTNIVVTADTSIYRYTTNAVKIAFTSVVTDEGVDGTVVQDDLSGVDSVSFWIYSTEDIASGDFEITLDDTDGTDQTYDPGVVSADTWTYVELDISSCDANCDTVDGVQFLATAQGAAAITGTVDVYLDSMYKFDVADEEALGVAIQNDGVLSVLSALTAGGTQTTLAEFTDYFVHYESGNDFIVWISDQSANDNVALVAY